MYSKIFSKRALIFVLVLINIIALYFYSIQREALQTVSSLNEQKELERQCAINQLSYIYVGNELENQLITKSELLEIKNYPKLIIRFDSQNCEACLQMLISNLELHKDQIGVDNIVLLGSFSNRNEFFYYKKKLSHLGEIVKIEHRGLGHAIDNKNLPYFFVIDEFQRYDDVFIPEKNNPSILDSYLKSIVTRFQANY